MKAFLTFWLIISVLVYLAHVAPYGYLARFSGSADRWWLLVWALLSPPLVLVLVVYEAGRSLTRGLAAVMNPETVRRAQVGFRRRVEHQTPH